MNNGNVILGLSVVLVFMYANSAYAGGPVFSNIAPSAGIEVADLLTESLAWGDYDNDGDEDLYLTNDGANNLFRNDGGGVFTDVTDITLTGSTAWGVGAAFGDLDNDGDLDLYVVNFSGGNDVLYLNQGPIGDTPEFIFSDISAAAGITDQSSSRGMAFIDYDRDGLLDIYVNAIGPDILYHNEGNLTFSNVAADLGVATIGQGVGVVATDIDNNGWVDLFTGNRSNNLNRLYTNNSADFTDITVTAGISEVGLGMGVAAFDYDNDLDMDLYWTAWPNAGPGPNALYENLGNNTFQNNAVSSGTDDPDGWGISINTGDIDNDGWEDFFVTNGFSDQTTANVLFQNNADDTFTDITSSLAGGGLFDGRGVAFADFDNDGDLDLCVTADVGESNRLWRNDTVNNSHWITLKLVGVISNRSAIGARIEVTTDIGTIVKEVSSGAGRGSFNSLPVEFGLGAATKIIQVLINWPSGFQEVLNNLPLDQFVIVSEGIITVDGFEIP